MTGVYTLVGPDARLIARADLANVRSWIEADVDALAVLTTERDSSARTIARLALSDLTRGPLQPPVFLADLYEFAVLDRLIRVVHVARATARAAAVAEAAAGLGVDK